MPPRSPNPRSGIVLILILFQVSAASLVLAALPSDAATARTAAARMARHAPLRASAAELTRLAAEAEALARTAPASLQGNAPRTAEIGLQMTLVLAMRLEGQLRELEQEMLGLRPRLRRRAAHADLAAGLGALRALRARVVEAKQELLILVTPRIIKP